jgi:hypothetical protein
MNLPLKHCAGKRSPVSSAQLALKIYKEYWRKYHLGATKVKRVILVAILLLSLFTTTITLAFQQSLQTPKTPLIKSVPYQCPTLCGASMKSTEPGSGGGGQGVI